MKYLSLVAAALVVAGPALASEQLSTKAGCATCHTTDKKLIGPSWHDVATKYKGRTDAPAVLAAYVRAGGKGAWGPLPMAPVDATKINDADLKTLLAWVLRTK